MQSTKKYPLRKIIKRERYSGYSGCNKGAYSVRLYLECGHEKVVKGSQEPSSEARCFDCWIKGQ